VTVITCCVSSAALRAFTGTQVQPARSAPRMHSNGLAAFALSTATRVPGVMPAVCSARAMRYEDRCTSR
jgi:hypothetical protein